MSERKENLWILALEIALAVGLVGGLIQAGWNIYRSLPADGSSATNATWKSSESQTKVTVTLRGDVASATLNSVDFYPFDLAAAQREFDANSRLARQFDDFLLRRMHGITPVTATSDGQGRAYANLNEGTWWLHATAWAASGETIEWRLPLDVKGGNQTVELTMENAYERTKKF